MFRRQRKSLGSRTSFVIDTSDIMTECHHVYYFIVFSEYSPLITLFTYQYPHFQ